MRLFNIFKKNLKRGEFYLVVILAVGFFVRLYKIDNPIADWHSWRQADTASVARNFYQEGFNPFIPKYDDLIGTDKNYIPNKERYRLVEFPIYNSLVYFAYLLKGGVDEKLARLVSVLMSLGSTLFLYLIVKRYWGVFTAHLSALLFAILPFNIYFSRVTLPEPTLVFFCLGMVYFTDLWISKNNRKLYFVSIFFTAMAFLVKPTAIFYFLPLVYLYYLKEGKWWPIPRRYLFFATLAFAPLLLWRVWISRFPAGIPPSGWLLDGDNIRFKPAFWRWIIGERLGKEILGAAGIVLFSLGALIKSLPWEGKFLHLLLLSMLAYLIVFATGNIRHDYYQILIIPILAAFTARGFTLLFKGADNLLPRFWTIPLALLLLFLTPYFGWQEVKGLYQINNGAIVEAGQEANKILPKRAVVLAPYNGDTAFLYQINRSGLAMTVLPIEKLKEIFGITHFVSVNYDDRTNWITRHYEVLEANPRFVIVDLTKGKLLDKNVPDPEPEK